MKKHLFTLGAGIFFLLPLHGYAEELPMKLAIVATTTLSREVVTGTTTASTTPVRTFTLCSQEAIETRDTRIASSRATYNIAMANALTERKNREKAAVAIIDDGDKKDAIKVSVDTYKSQAKAAQVVLVQARKVAWQSFENDIKKCHDAQSGEVMKQADSEPALMSEPATPAPSSMKKIEKALEKTVEKTEEKESKSIKETIKAQFENLKSLFN